jgi:hypothetical protein
MGTTHHTPLGAYNALLQQRQKLTLPNLEPYGEDTKHRASDRITTKANNTQGRPKTPKLPGPTYYYCPTAKRVQ